MKRTPLGEEEQSEDDYRYFQISSMHCLNSFTLRYREYNSPLAVGLMNRVIIANTRNSDNGGEDNLYSTRLPP